MTSSSTFKNSLALDRTSLALSPPAGTNLYAFLNPAEFAALTYSDIGLFSITPKFLSRSNTLVSTMSLKVESEISFQN